jgi:autotransporter-associated beta strand protein
MMFSADLRCTTALIPAKCWYASLRIVIATHVALSVAVLAWCQPATAASVTWTIATGKTGWGQTYGPGDGYVATGWNNWSSSSPDPFPFGSGTLPTAADDLVFDINQDSGNGVHDARFIQLGGNFGYTNVDGTGRFAQSMTFRGWTEKNFYAWGKGTADSPQQKTAAQHRQLSVVQGIVMEADSGAVSIGDTYTDTYTDMQSLVTLNVGTSTYVQNDSPSLLKLGPHDNTDFTEASVRPFMAPAGSTALLRISGTGVGGVEINTQITNSGSTAGNNRRLLGIDVNMPHAKVTLTNPNNSYLGDTTISSGTLAIGITPGGARGTVSSFSLIVKQGGVFDVAELPQGYVVPGRQTLAGDGTVLGAITVGGTARLSPGISVGTLTTTGSITLGALGNYNWQIADAAGTAGGTGWDLLTTSGVLDVQATVAEPFAINLWSLSGTNPSVNGNAANFNPGQSYTWRIATAAGGITNFAAEKFSLVTGSTTLGTSGFTNALSGGTFSLAQSGNDLNLLFTSTAAPVIIINVASGTQTQTQAGYPLLAGSTPVQKTGAGTVVIDQANTLTGSTTVQQGRLTLANSSALAASKVIPLVGGTVSLSPGLQTTVGGLAPTAGGLVDVGNGMVTVAAGLPAVDMVAALLTGRGDGSWTGTSGITSSTAAAELSQSIPRTVGWLDNGDGSVAFAYAAPGDTNLDWAIDILDAANFLALGKFDTGEPATWLEGDFDYDGIVDILDAADFLATGLFNAGNYNASPATAGAVAAVPEPATWAIMTVMLTAGLVARLRRRG